MVEKGECILTHELHCTYIYTITYNPQLNVTHKLITHRFLITSLSSWMCSRKKELLAILSENIVSQHVGKVFPNANVIVCEVWISFLFARGLERKETKGDDRTEFKRENRELWRKFSYEEAARVYLYMYIYISDTSDTSDQMCVRSRARVCVHVLADGRIFGWAHSPIGAFRDGKISRLSLMLSRQQVFPSAVNRRINHFSFVCNHSQTIKIINSKRYSWKKKRNILDRAKRWTEKLSITIFYVIEIHLN